MNDKRIMVHAIMGGKKPDCRTCEAFTRIGLMKATGNQHNWGFDWVEEELMTLPLSRLQALYSREYD